MRATGWVLVVVSSALAGCTYVRQRGNDLGDLWRVEASFGMGLQADVAIGEVLHLGLGSSMGYRTGWQYGHLFQGNLLEHFLPASAIESFRVDGYEGLHMISWWYEQPPQHQCFLFFPHAWGTLEARRDDLHAFDLEAGLHLVAAGLRLGFSPGELVDFVLGFWGFDLAGDDSEYLRGQKRLYRLPAERPPPP